MATRSDRLADFITDQNPPPGTPVQVLCEDHCGTYLLRFSCLRSGDVWKNAKTGETLDAKVVGWVDWVDGGQIVDAITEHRPPPNTQRHFS